MNQINQNTIDMNEMNYNLNNMNQINANIYYMQQMQQNINNNLINNSNNQEEKAKLFDLIKNISIKINEIHLLYDTKENNKLKDLVNAFNLNNNNYKIDDISSIINEEFDFLKIILRMKIKKN